MLVLEIESMKDDLKTKLRKNNKDTIRLDELHLENMHLRGDKKMLTKNVEKLKKEMINLESKHTMM